MKNNTVKIELDFNGQAFIVDACITDYTKTRLSTKEWMIEEISNCGYEDLMSPITKAGTYRVISVYDDYPEFTLLKDVE